MILRDGQNSNISVVIRPDEWESAAYITEMQQYLQTRPWNFLCCVGHS